MAHPHLIDMTGTKVGRLTVFGRAGNHPSGGATWWCDCECGKMVEVRGADLRNENVRSCGCLHIEQATQHQRAVLTPKAIKHGAYRTPEYQLWANMKDRCNNPNNKNFSHYGGRGVRVCPQWESSFEVFLADMGPRPSSKHSVDRYPDKNGDYQPGNVRWATQIEQANNKRNTRKTVFRGNEMTWAEAYRLASPAFSYQTFCSRMVSGWPVEKALS